MKILALGILLVLLVASWGRDQKKTKEVAGKFENKASAILPYKLTLDGLDSTVAKKRIDYFDTNRYADDMPEIVSVWIDKKIVQLMYALVYREHGDGIRMYFSGEEGGLPFLKTSIIFVSTKYEKATKPRQSDHRDYYNHDPNDLLFKTLKILKPILRNDDCEGAALLYKKNESSKECEPNDLHHLKVKDAEDMVKGFEKHVNETTSEWFDLDMFLAYTKNKYYDGIRIYYSTRKPGQDLAGRDCFVITTTVLSRDRKKHIDDFSCNTKNPFFYGFESSDGKKFTDPKDNGQLCPFNCN